VVPTFTGRLQTRFFTLGVIGLLWTLLVTPLLAPLVPGGLDATYRATLFAWASALLVGLVVWEPLYHLLMQFRWEKDWPTPFLLTESLPEALVVWTLLSTLGPGAPWHVFVLHFFSTWLVVFFAIQGPMRVVFLRWRFRGGRLR
jgi:hypothetical protein